MKRDLAGLARKEFDLLVIGGGIYGACAAWDAALRGLSVALVDKGDFGHATSSNTLRIIHGGLRYLQHAHIGRMRRSIQERTIFMRIAPHLVHPLPFLIPTYGHLVRGKEILSIALLVNEIVGFDQNALPDAQKHLPRGRVISREECLRLFPGVDQKGLTGGAIVYDCQMYSSERLILSFVRSADKAGADMANYVEVTGLLKEGARVVGVRARDVLTDEELDVRARVVVNTSGPWLDRVLGLLNGRRPGPRLILSKAFNLLVNRQFVPQYAVGIYCKGQFRDRDAILSKGSRLLFITPWQDRSLIGTVHLPYDADPDQIRVTEREIQTFLDEINDAYPVADLKREDVCCAYGGLLPVVGSGTGEAQLLKRYRIYDHHKEDGVAGLVSVTGVKFTEARHVAEKVVDLVFSKLDRLPPKSLTAVTPLYGGQIEQFQAFLARETQRKTRGFSANVIQGLIYQYGSAYAEVLKYLDDDPETDRAVPDAFAPEHGLSGGSFSSLVKGKVRYAIRREMAQKLADVIFRRTELGLAGDPGEKCLKSCAEIMSKELGWAATRTRTEIKEVGSILALRTLTQ